MNVSLTSELEKLVKRRVRSGFYQTASEVVREALRLLQERDRLRDMRLESLRKEIAVGIRQADRGEVAMLDIDDILNESFHRATRKKKRR